MNVCTKICIISVLAIVIIVLCCVYIRPRGEYTEYYYFPRISNRSVSYPTTGDECNAMPGFALAGLKAANVEFLKRTSYLLEHAQAVWVGGHFLPGNQYPYLVRWPNETTDARKAPPGVWCKSIDQMMAEVSSSTSMIPIVRTKTQPHCLTTYVKGVDLQRTSLPSLCLANKAKLEMDSLVPTSFRALFDRVTRSISLSPDRLACVERRSCSIANFRFDSRYSYIPVTLSKSYAMIAFRDLVNYEYARSVCQHVQPTHRLIPGQLFGPQSFRGDKRALRNTRGVLGQVIETVAKANGLSSGEMDNLYIPTPGYFKFAVTGSVDDYKKLQWENFSCSPYCDRPFDLSDTSKFRWCGSDYITNSTSGVFKLLETKKKEFDEWWQKEGGSQTQGPYIVRLAVAYKSDWDETCLTLSFDDLYWPGARSWVLGCQILPWTLLY